LFDWALTPEREHLEVRSYSRILIYASVLIILNGFQTIAIGQVSRDSGSNVQSAKTPIPKRKGTPPAAEPTLPSCPPAGLPTLQAAPQKTGHHSVTLSWDASAPSGHSEGKAVGYCLYRSKKQNAAKHNATCGDCEQINSTPLADTDCVDDLVEDGATYYYVVTAINNKGRISLASNEILAQVPSTERSANSIQVESYPLCRETKGLK
jgi:hypothetical protein